MLRSLIVFCLAFFLCGCSPTSLPEKTPPKTTAPTNSPSLAPSPSTQPQATHNNPPNYSSNFPIAAYTPVISPGVTTEEITMREQQVKIAKSFERLAEIRERAGVATTIDINEATYFRLNNEIQLLQAKRLLQIEQQEAKGSRAITDAISSPGRNPSIAPPGSQPQPNLP